MSGLHTDVIPLFQKGFGFLSFRLFFKLLYTPFQYLGIYLFGRVPSK